MSARLKAGPDSGAIRQHLGDRPPGDDYTMVVVRFDGGD